MFHKALMGIFFINILFQAVAHSKKTRESKCQYHAVTLLYIKERDKAAELTPRRDSIVDEALRKLQYRPVILDKIH